MEAVRVCGLTCRLKTKELVVPEQVVMESQELEIQLRKSKTSYKTKMEGDGG